MSRFWGCPIRVVGAWECPLCGRQDAILDGEQWSGPFVCDFGHRKVEMEQRLPEAFQNQRQHVNWEREGT